MNGVLYVLSHDTGGPDSYMNQYTTNAWTAVGVLGDTYGVGTLMQNGLIPSGSKLVALKSAAGTGIVSITDTIGSVIQSLVNPVADYSEQAGNNIFFTLSSITGATAYNLQIAYDSGFTNVITTIPMVPPNLNVIVGPGGAGVTLVVWQPGLTYYWRAQATAPFSSQWSGVRSFSIQPGAALVPAIGAPENGATIESTTPSFSWTPVAGTTQYQFQLSTDPTFASLTYSTSTMTTAVQVTTELTEGETYFWRVRALQPVTADWSAVANFTVAVPAPEPPATTTETVTPSTATTTVTMPVTLTVPPASPAPTTTFTVSVPAPAQPTTITLTAPAPPADEVITPSYIWAIIIIGAVLVIAVIVLIVRTRRTV
jgi:hypothetical protein